MFGCVVSIIALVVMQNTPAPPAPPANVAPQEQTPTSAPTSEAGPAIAAPDLSMLSVPDLLAAAERQKQPGGDLDLCQRMYGTILQREPRNVAALLGMSELAERVRQIDASRRYLLEAQKTDKNDPRVNIALGRMYVRSQNWRQAIAYLETAERFAPREQQAEIKMYLAFANYFLGRKAKASAYAVQAIDLDPESYEARQVMLMTKSAAKDYDGARQECDVIMNIARKRLNENPSDRANIDRMVQAIRMKREVLGKYHISLMELNADGQATDRPLPGRGPQASAALAEIVDLHVLEGELVYTLNLLENAVPLATKAVEFDPDNVKLLLTLGKLLANTSQAGPAVDVFRRVLEIDPANAEAVRYLDTLGAGRAAPTSAPAATPTP
ncbi:MAG: hypothetical protein CHACPFDD_01356 [Phycisphaerae bacterium]|nr:hypothetical protein [Phycisphaerae bacterium]